MTLLVELKTPDGIGFGDTVFVNPEAVESIDAHDDHSCLVRTKSYTYVVKGKPKEIAAMVMMPEMLQRAGLGFEVLDELEDAVKEKFG